MTKPNPLESGTDNHGSLQVAELLWNKVVQFFYAINYLQEDRQMKKSVWMFWFFFVVITLLSSSAMGAVYIKFEGVEGESLDASHTNWSDVLEVDQAYLLQTFFDGKIKEAPSKMLEVNDLVVTMVLDKAGPKIAEALLQGRAFATVNIELTASFTDAGRVTYYKYDLSNVRVTGYQLNASGKDEAGPPTQTVNLAFTGITVTYTEFDNAGNPKGDVGYSYEF